MECLAAGALQLLLRLKRHLKIVYDLNDARCQVCLSGLTLPLTMQMNALQHLPGTYMCWLCHQAYSPNETPKPGEGLSRQNLQFNVKEINIDPPNNYEDFVRRYQVN